MALFAVALLPATLSAQQPKIGCVDMSKLFPEYYKTKKAEVEMKDAQNALQKDLQSRQAEFSKMNDDYKKLKEDADNPAFTEQKRNEKRKAMETKGSDCRIFEQQSKQWIQDQTRDLFEKQRKTMQALVDDIVKTIEEKAKKEGYTMIVDKSSISPKGNPPFPVPTFLFLQDSIDITADVLKMLNANAPAGASSTSAGGDKSKDKK